MNAVMQAIGTKNQKYTKEETAEYTQRHSDRDRKQYKETDNCRRGFGEGQ